METEGQIPCSQKGTTSFSLQSQTNQIHTLLFARCFFESAVSYSEFVANTFYAGLFSPCMLHTPPISYSSYYKHNLIWSRNYEAYHYVTFFGLPLLPSWPSVLKQQFMFFPLRLGPSFTPIKRTDKERV